MFTTQRTVGCSHVDANGRLKLGAAADFMQDCSIFQLDSLTEVSAYFRAHGIGMYLVSRQMDLIRQPAYAEELTISTWVYACKSIYGYRNTMVYDAKGRVCIASYATGAFVHLASGRPVRMPAELIDNLALEPPYAMEYLPRKISLPAGTWQAHDSFTVPRFFLDLNAHVNNARYLETAAEYIPPSFPYERVRIEYKRPAKFGAQMHAEVLCGDNQIYVRLCSPEGAAYAVTEFTAQR